MKYYLKEVPCGTIIYDKNFFAVVLDAKKLLYIRYYGRDLVKVCSYFDDSYLCNDAKYIFPTDEK